jgi:fructose-bisphosphate aldolase class I
LSSGQNHLAENIHLNAINQLDRPKPWKLSFSFGRALQDEALRGWRGRPENVKASRQAFAQRAECASAAAIGRYSKNMDPQLAA